MSSKGDQFSKTLTNSCYSMCYGAQLGTLPAAHRHSARLLQPLGTTAWRNRLAAAICNPLPASAWPHLSGHIFLTTFFWPQYRRIHKKGRPLNLSTASRPDTGLAVLHLRTLLQQSMHP
jgi:hypothetical protein